MKTLRVAILVACASGAVVPAAGQEAPKARGSRPSTRFLELATARKLQIAALEAYSKYGKFPMNLVNREWSIPVFVDSHGTLCAVGHLMAISKRQDLVDGVRDSDVSIRIADLKDGPVVDWILESGLTQEECAFIQPSYKACEFHETEPTAEERKRLQAHFAHVTAYLREHLHEHLETAVRRSLAAKPAKAQSPVDFFLIRSPKADGPLRYKLTNIGLEAIAVRVLFLDNQGAKRGSDVTTTLKPRAEEVVQSDSGDVWTLVEYEHKKGCRLVPIIASRISN